MVAIAALFTIGGVAFGFGLLLLAKGFAEVDLMGSLKALALVTLASLASVPMILAAAGIGALMKSFGGQGFIAIIIGFAMITAIMFAIAGLFPMALQMLQTNMTGINFESTMKTLTMIALLLAIAIPLILVAGALGAAVMVLSTIVPGGGLVVVGAILIGLAIVGGVIAALAGMAGLLGSALKTLVSGMNIENPERVMKIIQIIGELMSVIATLGELAMMGAQMKAAEKLTEPGGDGEGVIMGMAGFITTVIDSLVGMVKSLVTASQDLGDPKAMKGAEILIRIIGGVAELASTLIEPLMSVQKNAGFFTTNANIAANMKSIADTMGTLFMTIKTAMVDMVTEMMAIFDGLSDEQINGLDKKATILNSVFYGIGAIAGTFKELNGAQKAKEDLNSLDAEAIKDSFKKMSEIMGSDAFFSTIEAFGKFADVSSTVDVGKLDEARLTFIGIKNVFRKFTEVIGKYHSQVFPPEIMTQMKTVHTLLEGFRKDPNSSPAGIVGRISEEAGKLAIAMNEMDADLGEVNLKPQLDAILGYDGEHKITIAPEAVNLNIKLSVVMDAAELATSIAKGNEDNDGFFKTTEKAAKALLEGDRGIGSWFGMK